MEELGETLDREEFIDACKRLHDSLNLADKNILVKRDSRLRSSSARARSQSVEDFERSKNNFKPKLNPNSLKMANKRSDHRLHVAKNEVDLRSMNVGFQREILTKNMHSQNKLSPNFSYKGSQRSNSL